MRTLLIVLLLCCACYAMSNIATLLVPEETCIREGQKMSVPKREAEIACNRPGLMFGVACNCACILLLAYFLMKRRSYNNR